VLSDEEGTRIEIASVRKGSRRASSILAVADQLREAAGEAAAAGGSVGKGMRAGASRRSGAVAATDDAAVATPLRRSTRARG